VKTRDRVTILRRQRDVESMPKRFFANDEIFPGSQNTVVRQSHRFSLGSSKYRGTFTEAHDNMLFTPSILEIGCEQIVLLRMRDLEVLLMYVPVNG
jgi:hypothetical protein